LRSTVRRREGMAPTSLELTTRNRGACPVKGVPWSLRSPSGMTTRNGSQVVEAAFDDSVTGGAYERTVRFLLQDVPTDRAVCFTEALALGAPPWFVRRLAAETGEEVVQAAGEMEIVYLGATPVIGLNLLDRQPLGRFVAQDLLEGSCYRLPFFCHPEVDPTGWPSLTLAVQDGLNLQLAVALANIGV
jgi:hypothetical protein